ncbi:hypothetical protein CRYUN_Cryun16bG0043900 [Craigia yunnanensis]
MTVCHCLKKLLSKTNFLGGIPKELEDIGREIVGKCKGLPLAVKSMAGLLHGNVDINKWKQILRHSIWELEVEENPNKPKILHALKLSYDHLPSYLKQCFTYCSVFPKAYVFYWKELVKLWMAETFIQPNGQTSIEDTGIEYFDELLMRSFFQIFYINDKLRYRMHDFFHEFQPSGQTSVEETGIKYVDDLLSRSFLQISNIDDKVRSRMDDFIHEFIQTSGKTSVEEIGIEYFDELLRRSIFQIFNIDDKVRYRMHDLIHDLAASVSTPQCCLVKDNKSCILSEKSCHVLLLCPDLDNPTL